MIKKYDLIIIGGGASGLTAAYTAKGFGKSVLLIEKNKPGGECTWSGCIPSKTLIKESTKYAIAGNYNSVISLNYSKILKRINTVIKNIYDEESFSVLNKDGIDTVNGEAVFADSKSIEVNGHLYSSDYIHIAAGSKPFIPPVEGLIEANPLTNETIFKLKHVPSSIVFIGGGPIGVELAQSFSRLGSRVTIVEMKKNLLPLHDESISKVLEESLKKEGIKVYTLSKLVKVKKNKQYNISIEERNGELKIIRSEEIFCAAGRYVDYKNMRLENAGVLYDGKGIWVDENFRTAVKNISASGDAINTMRLSHVCEEETISAIVNLFLPVKKKVNYNKIPYVVFTDPQAAAVGLSEIEAEKKYGKKAIKIFYKPYSENNRAVTEGKENGFLKIILNKKGLVIGAHCIGENADEIIQQLAIAMHFKIKFSKFQAVVYSYPIYSDIIKRISREVYFHELNSSILIKIIKLFRGRKRE